MLRILPIASSFHSAEQVRATIQKVSQQLGTSSIAHEILASAAAKPNVLFIVTGGTEHLALQALEGQSGPVILLAHPEQNSLPASLEILSYLQQKHRRGRIVLLNESEEGPSALRDLDRALSVRERMGAMRLGRIGMPSDWLIACGQETSIAQKVWGPEIVDVPLDALRSAMRDARSEEVEALSRDFQSDATATREPSQEDITMASRVAVGLRRVICEHKLDACTVRCFDLVLEQKTTGCLALSSLLDDGVVAGCEGDLPAALTMLWLQEMSGQLSFMANPQDLDAESNTLWLAHCTIARRMLKRYTLRSHFESSLGVGIQGELAPGPYTLARIGGNDLCEVFLSDAELLANGSSELRCRTQVQVRLQEKSDQLLTRPLGNHHVLIPGHWAKALKEFHSLFIAS
jgi:L-fucose isomerase-like protein